MTKEEEIKLKKTSELFNSMPFEYRKIASNAETATRVRDLLKRKEELKRDYDKEIKRINERIKFYIKTIDN